MQHQGGERLGALQPRAYPVNDFDALSDSERWVSQDSPQDSPDWHVRPPVASPVFGFAYGTPMRADGGHK
jgi:hypothetical protein